MALLLTDVSADFSNLHSIKESSGNGVEGVGATHRKEMGEIYGEVETLIKKTPILLWVENLEERPRWIVEGRYVFTTARNLRIRSLTWERP